MESEIRTLLQESGVSFKTNGKSFIMACPRCRKAQKLYIRKRDGVFCCWICRESDNFQGKAEYALTELCGLPIQQVRKQLYGENTINSAILYLDIGIKDFADEDEEEFLDIKPKMPSFAWPLDFFPISHQASIKGLKYLENRGISQNVALEYDIRYCPVSSRVIFPVKSHDELYGWQARLIENDKSYWDNARQKNITPLKILTSTDLKRDMCLMFADRLEGQTHCVLTEGPVDALHAHLCGGNVATMGKAVSNSQLQLIRNSGIEKLYLGLDPDAWMEINRIRQKMSDMIIYDFRPPAPYKDLGEMPMEAVKQLFDKAPILNPAQVILHLKTLFGAS